MSLVKLKPHLALPTRIPFGSGDGILLYDSSEGVVRLATQAEINSQAFSNPFWDDFQVNLTATKLGANSKPDFDFTNIGYLFPQNDASEILYFIAQLPHKWKEGSAIYPHIHWQQAADQTPIFKLDYKIYNNGTAPPGAFTTYSMSTKESTYVSGTIGQISFNTTPIDMTGKEISCLLHGKLYRDDNAYTGDVLATSFDFHIEIDAAGSDEEYVK